MKSIYTVAFTLMATLAVTAFAADYDEAVDGDLGDQTSGPTIFDVDVGLNSVTGTVGDDGSLDEDFVAFEIKDGEQLDAVTLTSFTPAGGNTSTGFRLYTDQGAGYVQASSGSFGKGDVGTNYLTVWDLSDVGGSIPVGPGNYGVLLAEFTPDQAYSFDIAVSAVPEPAGLLGMALLGISGLGLVRRRG